MRRHVCGMLWAAPLVAAVALASCGPRTLAHGVVLWGRADGPDTGTVLPVVARSTLDKTVTLWNRDTGARDVLEAWRVRDDFRRIADAEAYAEQIEPYARTFAFTDRTDGLPIREKPDTQAPRVYKVAPAQLLKVLGRGEEKSSEADLEAYWYEVLTEDGYRGWVFGYYLRTFEATRGQEETRMQEVLSQDPVEDKLFSGVWRPEYFADMMRSGRVDLRRFTPDVGLFPDRQASTWKLVLGDLETVMIFDRVEKPAPGVYTFPPSDLRIMVYPGDRLEVSYRRAGRLARTVFVQISDDDVQGVIQRETERRRRVLESFLERGTTLSSTAYGTLSVQPDGRFQWSGFSRIPAGVFLRGVAGAGRIDFPDHLSPELSANYAGVVSFVFDEYRDDEETTFLYAYASGGLQLTRVLPQDIEDLEVRRVSPSPLVMFFRFQGS